MTQKIRWLKICMTQKFYDSKYVWLKKSFDSKYVWLKNCMTQNMYDSKIVWQKNWMTQNMFNSKCLWLKMRMTQNMYDSKIVWLKKFYDSKYGWLKIWITQKRKFRNFQYKFILITDLLASGDKSRARVSSLSIFDKTSSPSSQTSSPNFAKICCPISYRSFRILLLSTNLKFYLKFYKDIDFLSLVLLW